MSDKHLTTKEWQKFAAGSDYKDAALLKALAAAEKARDAEPQAQQRALDALEAAGRELLKQHKGDKKLGAYLDDISKQARLSRQQAEQAAEKAAGKAAASDGEQAEDTSAALMDPKRLLQQLNHCRRDPERRVQFGYADGKDKAPGALALSPKVAGRRLFALLSEETGVKTGAFGTAWVQDNELILQLDKPSSGLVKKLRQPVKACGFKAQRIVLWNADGSVFEAEDAAESAKADDATNQAAVVVRLKALLPHVVAAGTSVEGRAAKVLAAEAGARLQQGDVTGASNRIDKIQQLLGRVAAAGLAPGVLFTRSRLAWDATRKHVQQELRKLEQFILAEASDEPDYATIAANTNQLYTVLDRLDDRLIDVLDDALNASLAAERQAHQRSALGLVEEYLGYISGGDSFLQAIGDNGFVDVDIAPLVSQRLGEMRQQLSVMVA